jgi:hypothetical protein
MQNMFHWSQLFQTWRMIWTTVMLRLTRSSMTRSPSLLQHAFSNANQESQLSQVAIYLIALTPH